MKVEYLYWYFKSAIPKTLCKEIIDFAKKQKSKLGGTFGIDTDKKITKETKHKLKKYRDSNIVWLNEPWIYEAINPYISMANKNANWNFEISVCENAQFTIYNKNQYYHWHQDSLLKPYDTPDILNKNGKIRKLSASIILSDPKDYEGGELQFLQTNEKDCKKNQIIQCKECKEQGSIIVFPSFVYHCVKPVKKGTRYSLVLWYLGQPFK